MSDPSENEAVAAAAGTENSPPQQQQEPQQDGYTIQVRTSSDPGKQTTWTADDFMEWARYLGLTAGLLLVLTGIIFFFVALFWDTSTGRKVFWMIICVYELCLGLFLLALELPYAPMKESLAFLDNPLHRSIVYLLMAVFGFITGWWGTMIGVICLIVAGLFYLMAAFKQGQLGGEPSVAQADSQEVSQQDSQPSAPPQQEDEPVASAV